MRILKSVPLATVATALTMALASCSIWDGNGASSGGRGQTIGAGAANAPKQAATYAFATRQPVKVMQVESAPRPPVETAQFKRTAYLGNAPYICSPSGFGRKSACFLR